MTDTAPRPLWVFGYGSLIWNPDFPVSERRLARLAGWHRAFCMRSIHHRGTEDKPGLVLALDAAPAAHCDGVLFRVEDGAEDATLAALRARELISSAYLERWLPVAAEGGLHVSALAYVVDPQHRQYCQLELEEQARIIAHARGGRGANRDYLWQTAQHLAELGLPDPDLDWLAARVRALTGAPET